MRQVKAGQPLQVALDAYPGKTFEGRVFAVNRCSTPRVARW